MTESSGGGGGIIVANVADPDDVIELPCVSGKLKVAPIDARRIPSARAT